MILDSESESGGSVGTDLATAVERALSLEVWVSSSRERVASESFVGRHTQFGSVEEFCAACPSEADTVGSVQRLPADERDAFVDRTTDFETWAEMKRSAAVEDLLTLQSR
jgi:hypothetical protein